MDKNATVPKVPKLLTLTRNRKMELPKKKRATNLRKQKHLLPLGQNPKTKKLVRAVKTTQDGKANVILNSSSIVREEGPEEIKVKVKEVDNILRPEIARIFSRPCFASSTRQRKSVPTTRNVSLPTDRKKFALRSPIPSAAKNSQTQTCKLSIKTLASSFKIQTLRETQCRVPRDCNTPWPLSCKPN